MVVASSALGGAWAWAQTTSSPRATENTNALYDRYCAACHGVVGDGRGPGAPLLWPQPRDFTSGNYKWRSTASGLPPTDEDLRTAIRFGVPGTSMHGFDASLNNAQIDQLIAVLKGFAPRKFRRKAIPLPIPAEPPPDLERGKLLFTSLGCVKCHGESATGNGPSSPTLKNDRGHEAAPYDLTQIPVRRPRPPGQTTTTDIYRSLVTGLSGSPMPSYQGAAPDQDLWAVSSYVQSLAAKQTERKANRPSTIAAQAQSLDAKEHTMRGGYYPGHGNTLESGLFGGEIMPQGTPSKSLTPAQASLSAKRCARCHNKQYREWGPSLHASAGSPGLIAQLLAKQRQGTPAAYRYLQSCQRCHNPLAEQNPVLSRVQSSAAPSAPAYTNNPKFSEELRTEGLTCASCHVRGMQRFGPPARTDNTRLALPGYPLTELAIYERSDFCMPCHQLSASSASLDNKPLLNTYKEWLEGPYMPRGVQCQHCHMPDREHTWKGVHDPETFRQGIEVSSITGRSKGGVVSVRVRVKNSGAGHYLPTTPTPAAWVSITLVDSSREPIDGAYTEKRIGRHLAYQNGWKQLEDTRIPPGEHLELTGAWKQGRVASARYAKVEIRVQPDEYYERFYIKLLKNTSLPQVERDMLNDALRRTRKAEYSAQTQWIPIVESAN